MKALILLLFILVYLETYGQTCDTIEGRIVNCSDSGGLKYGEWEFWNFQWRQKENYGPVPGFCQTAPLIHTRTTLRSKGKYLEDKKIGRWEYFEDNGDAYGVSRVEIYEPDGSVKVVSDSKLVTTLYNQDSSLVTSTVIAQDKDTVYVSCENGNCTASFMDTEFIRFALKNLDFEQYRIVFGMYQRKIGEIKNSTY